jgi:hypothetical protein
LLTTAVVAVFLGLIVGAFKWGQQMIRKADRYAIRQYIIDEVADPEYQRELGLFTDEEIDAMIVERDRLASRRSSS